MIRNNLTFFAPKHVDRLIPSVQGARGRSVTRLRQPGRDADNSSPFGAKVNNKHSFTFTRLQDHIVCTETTLPLMQVVLLVIPVLLTQNGTINLVLCIDFNIHVKRTKTGIGITHLLC